MRLDDDDDYGLDTDWAECLVFGLLFGLLLLGVAIGLWALYPR